MKRIYAIVIRRLRQERDAWKEVIASRLVTTAIYSPPSHKVILMGACWLQRGYYQLEQDLGASLSQYT
jgi:hypothetical protein